MGVSKYLIVYFEQEEYTGGGRMSEIFVLNIELYSEELKESEKSMLEFPQVPVSLEVVVNRVTTEFSTPGEYQTLWLRGNKIDHPENSQLSALYIRSGDTLKVTYPMKCESQKINNLTKWLLDTTKFFNKINESNPDDSSPLLSSFKTSINDFRKFLNNLNGCFTPWSSKLIDMNRAFFYSTKGIKLLVNFHKELTLLHKVDSFTQFKNIIMEFEGVVCITFSNLARNPVFCKRITDEGGLECCITSFLKYTSYESDWETHVTISQALQALGNISDIPENHLYLSMQRDVITHVIAIITTPEKYDNVDAFIALNLLLNLANCKEAHEQFFQSDLVKKICDSIEERMQIHERDEINHLLIFYGSIFLSELVLGSTQLLLHFPDKTLQKMLNILSVIATYNATDIKRNEKSVGAEWDSFKFLLYLYEPEKWSFKNNYCATMKQVHEIWGHSVDIILISLQSTLGTTENIKIISEEGLMDYVTMLPWNVPQTSKLLAQHVVDELLTVTQLQPPSLVSIAKAKLSKSSFGIVNVINETSLNKLLSKLQIY